MSLLGHRWAKEMRRKQQDKTEIAELRAEIAALRLREAERDMRIACLERALDEGRSCEDLPERPPGQWASIKAAAYAVGQSPAFHKHRKRGAIPERIEGGRILIDLERCRGIVRSSRMPEDVPMLPHERHDRPWTAAAPRPHRRA